jgi:beta-lactamase regulating signal transducer with metallopeptidase domain
MFPIVRSLSIARIADPWIAIVLPVALKGSLLVGLLLLAGRLMRSASASARHLIWTLGMIGLLLLPVLEAGLPSWRVVPVPDSVSGIDGGPKTAAASVAVAAVDASAGAGEPDAGSFHALREAKAFLPLSIWCFLFWVSGILMLLLARAWGMARLGRFRKEARPLESDGWPALLRSLCRDLGVDTPPALLTSPHAPVPMTWGLRRPVILLPGDCHDWPEELRRQVLLHELAHVGRRDCLTQFAARCACLLHWCNPLVWMAAGRMCVERELACDDLVLSAGALPSSYANHLLQIACHLGGRDRAPAGGLEMAHRSRLFDRLDAVLDSRRRRRAPGRRAVAIAACMALTVVTGLSALGPMARARGENTSGPASGGGLQASSVPDLPSVPSLPLQRKSGLDVFASGRPMSCEFQMNGINVKMKMKGRIQFKEDYTGIVRMDDSSGFAIEEKRGRRKTTLRAEPGGGGQPVCHFQVGRDSRPFDSEGGAWLARTIEFVMLVSGFDADERVRHAYEQGCLRGVLALIDQVDSDVSKSMYYAEFFALDNLPDAEIAEALGRIRRDIESDYLRASILISYVDRHLGRENTREAFLACLSSIESDYERRQALQSGLDGENRTPGELAMLLAAVDDLRSDYEAAQFLTAFDPDLLADQGTSRAYFATFDGLDSDYEKANVLVALARRAGSDEKLREICREAAQRLDSSWEYSRVIRTLR